MIDSKKQHSFLYFCCFLFYLDRVCFYLKNKSNTKVYNVCFKINTTELIEILVYRYRKVFLFLCMGSEIKRIQKKIQVYFNYLCSQLVTSLTFRNISSVFSLNKNFVELILKLSKKQLSQNLAKTLVSYCFCHVWRFLFKSGLNVSSILIYLQLFQMFQFL